MFTEVFQAFERIRFGEFGFKLGDFLDELEVRLVAAEEKFNASECGRYANYGDKASFTGMVLHKLRKLRV